MPVTNYNHPLLRSSHQSPITNHQSPITNHQSPITNHQSPITNLTQMGKLFNRHSIANDNNNYKWQYQLQGGDHRFVSCSALGGKSHLIRLFTATHLCDFRKVIANCQSRVLAVSPIKGAANTVNTVKEAANTVKVESRRLGMPKSRDSSILVWGFAMYLIVTTSFKLNFQSVIGARERYSERYCTFLPRASKSLVNHWTLYIDKTKHWKTVQRPDGFGVGYIVRSHKNPSGLCLDKSSEKQRADIRCSQCIAA